MSLFVERARGVLASYCVGHLHGHPLVFRIDRLGKRLIVPPSCRQLVLDEFHHGGLKAHMGARKTFDLLASRVWWPNMWQHV